MLLLAVVAAWAHTYSQTVFITVLLLALRLQQRGAQGIPAKFRSLGLLQTNYTWLTGGGTNADYEIRWTIISTTPTTGVTGTWINMSVGEDLDNSSHFQHQILSRSCRDSSGSGSKYSSGLNNCDLECRE
jgi:hypothetical protein